MAKFYVQCGSLELVQTTDSAESAALAIIDRVLQPHLWIYDDEGLSEQECRQHLMLEALLHLPTEIHVSERGFGRSDADVLAVPETIHSWHALMVGMRRLFSEAGLDRSVAVLVGAYALDRAFSGPNRPR